MAADWESLWGPHMGGWARFMAYATTCVGVLMVASAFFPGRGWWAVVGVFWLLFGGLSFWRAHHPTSSKRH